MEKANCVEIENLKFLSVERKSLEKTSKDFDNMIDRLEKFLRILEKKFGEIIWYIGTDIFENEINERFVFKKSGFMEISLSGKSRLKAWFPEKEKAEKFLEAFKKTIEKIKIK